MAERSGWTDNRIDDLVAHLYARFDQVDARFAEMDRRMGRFEDRLDRVLEEMLRMQRQIAIFGWGVIGALFVQMVVAVTAALIASS